MTDSTSDRDADAELRSLRKELASCRQSEEALRLAHEQLERRAEQRLNDTLAFNESLLEASSVGIIVYKTSGECLLANPAAARTVGGTQEQLLAQNFRQLESWQHSGLLAAADEALATGAITTPSIHVLTTFGKQLLMECRFIPFAFEGETRLMLMFEDITERQRLEETRERERAFRALAENSVDIIARFDRGLRRIYVNPAIELLLGRPRSTILGKTHREMGFPPELADTLDLNLEETFMSAKPRSMEVVLPTPLGERHLESKLVPEFGPDGNVETVLGISRDITERKRVEEALRRANAELQQFAYVASHDLQAPLRAISNLTTCLEEDVGPRLSSRDRHKLRLIRRRAGLMHTYIQGLLAYSRAGGRTVMVEPVDTRRLIHEFLATHDIPGAFEIIAEDSLPRLVTDRAKLQQVLVNLIANAVKHHDRPDGRIWVSAQDEGDRYEFLVADDGPGIADEDKERIFEMLQRGPSLKADEEGTGIGLAVAKKVVETVGGRIRVESTVGRGAAFLFTWPKEIAPNG